MVKKLTISDDEASTDNESVIEEVPKEVKVTKPKKVMSAKQLETLAKGRENRKLKIEESKLECL
jgi:hypothetical protein